MKTQIVSTLLAVAAASLVAADAKSDVEMAAKKLGDKANYSWTSASEGSSQREGDRQGKIEKGGFAMLTQTVRDNEVQAVVKGEKGVIKIGDSWRTFDSLAESEDQEERRMRFMVRRLQQFKAPHEEVQALAQHVKELKKDEDGVYSGSLTAAGLNEVFFRGFRRRDGGEGPDTSGLTGRVKIWVQDGVLSKYSTHVEGNMKFGDRDVDVDRTTTVQIKDVGSTKVAVPEDAKKKLST